MSVIESYPSGFTTKELYQSLDGEIGLATIYRFLEELKKEGQLLQFNTDDNTAKYQYAEPCSNPGHFYLKCIKCGKLEHVDCKKIKGLIEHIYNDHHFRLGVQHIIINGICADCAK